MKFDIIIRNGIVIDGSNNPAVEKDIGISGKLIAALGDLKGSKAAEEIDAKGKIVCPGFIDIHGHSDYFILIEPGAPNKLRQGVTTEIGGNCGYSAAPISKKLSDERGEAMEHNFGFRPDWLTPDDYYHRLDAARPALNFGILVGHNTVRASVMGGDARPPTDDEMARMKAMIREGMAAGALGISAGLIYPPACFSSSDEIAELCREAREGFFATHMRSEGAQLVESVREVIGAAKKAGIRLQISHLKTSGKHNWHKMDEVIRLMEDARLEGLDVRCDRYPYTSSFTGLSSALPAWVFEGTREHYRARLILPEVRERIRIDLEREHPGGDYLDNISIAQTFSMETNKYEGLRVSEAARLEKKAPLDFLLDLLAKEESDPTAIYHTMSEENMKKVLKWKHAVVGSDSAARAPGPPLGLGKPHPRAYGCFPRMLRLIRETGFIPMEEAVSKMTGETAKIAGLDKRGLLKEGWHADVVVFDPGKVTDNGTYDNPHQFATGFDCVIVNGKIAVRDDRVTGERNGMVLKRNME